MASPLSRTSSSSSSVELFRTDYSERGQQMKLCRTNYSEWRQQMLDLFEGDQLVGFVDGSIQPPEEEQNQEEYWSWKTSDGLARQCIFNMVTEEILEPLAKVPLATAREAWIALEEMLNSLAPSLPQSINGTGAASPRFPKETNPTTKKKAPSRTPSSSSAVKLSQTNYSEWKEQMLDVLETRQQLGFVDGTIQQPDKELNREDYWSWKKYDGQVRRLIFKMVTEEILKPLAEEPLATAREAWIALEEMLSPVTVEISAATQQGPTSLVGLPRGTAPGLPTETTPPTRIMESPPSRTSATASSTVYYPCPSGVNVADFVPLKLCPTNYSVWKQLILNLIESHELEGFVDGTIQPPPFPLEKRKQEEYRSWKRSNSLVRGWILVTVKEEILPQLVHLATAREAWIALEEMLRRSAPSLPQSIGEAAGAASGFPTETNPTTSSSSVVKLCRTNYSEWRQQMLDLLRSRQLVGFVDGTIQPPEKEQNKEDYLSWKRSDGYVRSLIFIAVTQEILEPLALKPLETAREAWIALEKMLSPVTVEISRAPQKGPASSSLPQEFEDEMATRTPSRYLPLYRAIRNGDWENATKFLEQEPDGARDAISEYSETALMLVVGSSKRNDFVKKLMERMLPEDVARQNINGQTALHAAVISGNDVAAKLLVKKNPELPNIQDKGSEIEPSALAVHYAARRGNREMVEYLLKVTKLDGDPNRFEGQLGVQLLNNLIDGELYDNASTFLQHYPKLAHMDPTLLLAISYRLESFRSTTRLNLFQSLIYSGIPLKLEGKANKPVGRDIENSAESTVSLLGYLSQKLHAMFWDVAEKFVPLIKSIRETKLIHHQALKFVKHLCAEVVKNSALSNAYDIFHDPMANAATLGICEIVEEILEIFPKGIFFKYQIFQLAIENRQENVFNLIYQLEENRNFFFTRRDEFLNIALHTAGDFGSRQQLSLQANVAGAALQMQRELQWFKAVEKLVRPQNKYVRNNKGKIPQDVFTETHKDLVKEGEKWMKDTATSCTIVAALIVTVVFAAAITVPGGSNNENGRPIFLEKGVFVLFGVFDALALFSSTTSLLMFLSIFTSRYGEQDFLYSLPRRLIIGLVTLFLSIISMMIAFGATLKIVFGHKGTWIMIPIVVLSFVPITLFVLLQFPLLLDVIRSTYYPGLSRKRSNRMLL